jgi:hypothetical protein
MDNHSRCSKSELMEAALESDLQVYSISTCDPLTRRTGGIQIVVRDNRDVNKVGADIAQVIRDRDGKWHSIKVNVTAPNAAACARSGFYAR